MKNPIRISICVFALLQSLCVLSFVTPANAQLQNILSAISKDTLLARMRELTGDLPVMIGGQQRTIYTRMAQTTGNRWAAQYLEDQFKRLGLTVQRQYFHSTHARNPFYVNFTALARSGRKFWMTSDWGEIFRSDDTGRTWISYKQSGTPQLDPQKRYTPPDTSDRLDWICVVDSSTIFAVGKTGIQTVTIDGGRTWQSRQTGFTNLVHAANNGRTILAVCQNGLVWRSTNSGTSWTKQIIDTTTASFAQAAFVSPTQAYIAGSDRSASAGRLYATTDGGSTWALISTPASTALQSIFALNASHIWIASSNGNILSTRSAGSSWSSNRYSDSSYVVNRIFFCDTLNGWISASGNKLYRTTNGGSTWALASTFASTMQIQGFNFLTPSRGILVGGEYSGFATSDGGVTWKDNTIPLLSNVVATLPGMKPSTRYILVTAHYDLDVYVPDNKFLAGHGADDDGSGTVGLLELARAFAQHPLPVPIKFAAVPDEEWGMDGSFVLGEKLLAEPDTVLAVLDLDMIGYDYLDPRKMTLHYASDSGSVDLANRFINAVEENSIGLSVDRQPNSGGSNTNGFSGKASVLMMIESDYGITPNYHLLKDSWSSLSGVFLENSVRAAAALIYDMGLNGVLPYPKPQPQSQSGWKSIIKGRFTGITAFAATGQTIFGGSSTDGVSLFRYSDSSWISMSTGLTNKNVFALAIETGPGGVGVKNLYAGTAGGGVFRSTNSGTSWTTVNTGLTNLSIRSLATYPNATGGTNVLAGTAGGGVFLSTNNGSTWTAVNSGMENTNVYSFAVNSNSSSTVILAGTLYDGVFASTNGGMNWATVNVGLTNLGVKALAIVPSSGGSGSTIFAGTYGGLFLSTNNGSSWTPVNLDSANSAVVALAAAPASMGGNVFASSSAGLYLVRHIGSEWIASVVGSTTDEVFRGASAVGVTSADVFVGKGGTGNRMRSLSSLLTSVRSSPPTAPSSFKLEQNYPNPFNPSTTISYSLPKAANVSLKIFNVLGQLVATLVDEKMAPGYHSAMWSPSVPSGIYLYRLQAGDFVETKKMILMK